MTILNQHPKEVVQPEYPAWTSWWLLRFSRVVILWFTVVKACEYVDTMLAAILGFCARDSAAGSPLRHPEHDVISHAET